VLTSRSAPSRVRWLADDFLESFGQAVTSVLRDEPPVLTPLSGDRQALASVENQLRNQLPGLACFGSGDLVA
jgi:hypothetical protein